MYPRPTTARQEQRESSGSPDGKVTGPRSRRVDLAPTAGCAPVSQLPLSRTPVSFTPFFRRGPPNLTPAGRRSTPKPRESRMRVIITCKNYMKNKKKQPDKVLSLSRDSTTTRRLGLAFAHHAVSRERPTISYDVYHAVVTINWRRTPTERPFLLTDTVIRSTPRWLGPTPKTRYLVLRTRIWRSSRVSRARARTRISSYGYVIYACYNCCSRKIADKSFCGPRPDTQTPETRRFRNVLQ